MEMPMKAALISIVVAITGGSAFAQARPVLGTAGYLSEWEIVGNVTLGKSSDGSVLAGPVIWKHVGLCSANGPEQRSGQVTLHILRSWLGTRIKGSLTMGDDLCTYDGDFAKGTRGVMNCTHAKSIPLTLSIN
jgi:hypothetical protein